MIVGVVAALALGGIIRNQLFGVTVFDPATLDAVVVGAAGQRRARQPAAGQPRRAHRSGDGVSSQSQEFQLSSVELTTRLETTDVTRCTMPDWLEPMAATLTQERFAGDDWLFERKFDGIRLLAYKRGGDVKLYSRNRLLQNIPDDRSARSPRCRRRN